MRSVPNDGTGYFFALPRSPNKTRRHHMNNNSVMVHYAVACLEGLHSPATPRDLSRSQRVPLEECLHILRQLESAGIVRENAQGLIERTCSIEELTALQVLQALWSPPTAAAIRMLYGEIELNAEQVTRRVVHAAAWPRG